MFDSLRVHGLYGILQARILEWVAFPFSRGSSQPRDGTQISHIAGAFFTSWAIREAQEYWVGSLFLLQGIFPTQELNWGLLHCKQILYQLREENKVSHCFHSPPPTICHEMMGPDALILVFWMLSFKPAFHSPLSPSSRGPLVPLHFLP